MSRSVVHHRPTFCSASRSSSSTARSSTSIPLRASLASCGVSPSASSASRTSAERPADDQVALRTHAIAQIQDHALGDLLADAGHHRQRPDVARDDRPAEASGVSDERNARATFGPTPVTPVSRSNSSRSSVDPKP